MMIEVIKPGALTTVQDLGRFGYQRFGVPVGGAMDEQAHRLANLLVGNAQGTAALEITMMGPSLRFTETALIAITGADLSPRISEQALPRATPVLVRAGSQIDFGRRTAGLRAYLAVHGGFAVEPVMGSRSTYLRGGFGGFAGRALRKGDLLPVAPGDAEGVFRELRGKLQAGELPFAALDAPPQLSLPAPGEGPTTVRVTAGEQWLAFTDEARRALGEVEFRLSPQSDRMGLRFEGPKLALREPLEMISEAVAFGTVQVPPDGNPIVLMADRQTTGGYPKIASVATVDLPLLAQLAPQQAVRFALIPLQEAQRLDQGRERALADLARQVESRRRG